MFSLISFILLIQLIECSEKDQLVIQPLTAPSNLEEGRRVFLNCQALKGEKPFNYEWKFNDKKLVYDDNVHVHGPYDDLSILTINNLKYKNIGNYTCIISNKYASDSSTVSIEFKGTFFRNL
jgi:hypothetical protein